MPASFSDMEINAHNVERVKELIHESAFNGLTNDEKRTLMELVTEEYFVRPLSNYERLKLIRKARKIR